MMLFLALTLLTVPPDTLTLNQAYRSATEHYPRVREVLIAQNVRDLRIRNLDARFLPAVSLGGQAVYQSDLPSIPISAPGLTIPTVSHDQYRIGLTVDQLLFDGGLTSVQKQIERSNLDVVEQEIAVAAYGLREQVEGAWFTVLLSEAEAASLDVYLEDVKARLDQARVGLERGIATGSNVEVLQAELIRLEQQRDAARSRRRAGLDVLEVLTGWTLSDNVQMAMPVIDVPPTFDVNRPEMHLFETSRRNLDFQAMLSSRKTRPRIASFVDAAVGRPQGLDVFQNTFGPFFSAGVRIGWSLWDWDSSNRDEQAFALQSESVQAREDAFEQQVHTRTVQLRRAIERLQESLTGDAEILQLRAHISAEALSKLNNGVITATDYLMERNAEHRARLDEQLHRIQLAQARVQLVTILGAT